MTDSLQVFPPGFARVRELFHYDAETGVFTRKIRTSNSTKVGDVAGGNNGNGYVSIWVDGRRVLAHRLAWFYVHGEWPTTDVDHINGNPQDNRIANLRLATRSQNLANMKPHRDGQSGFNGVSWYKPTEKWTSQIWVNGKNRRLGYFSTAEEAAKAYADAAQAARGEFARTE
jgi:hypothetical protein